MKKILSAICAVAMAAVGFAQPTPVTVQPATPAEVNAGVVPNKYVSPATLFGAIGSAVHGSGVANQVAIWTGTGTIGGDADFTFSGDTLTATKATIGGISHVSNIITAATTANLTLTPGGNSKNVVIGNTVNGSRLDLGSLSGTGTFQPVIWSDGSRYALTGGHSVFNSVQDNLGGISYNPDGASSQPLFGLSFESWYDYQPTGVETEFYYSWTDPTHAAVTGLRPMQINVSLGVAYGAPSTRPVGWINTQFLANQFAVNKTNASGDFTLDLDASPKLLSWSGNALVSGVFTKLAIASGVSVAFADGSTVGGASNVITLTPNSNGTVAIGSNTAGSNTYATGALVVNSLFSVSGSTGDIRTSGKIYIGSTAPSTSDLLNLRDDSNAGRGATMQNRNSSGTAAYSYVNTGTNASTLGIEQYGQNFTTSGAQIQDGGRLIATGSGGLAIHANGGTIKFYQSTSTLAGTINGTAWTLPGTLSVTGHLTVEGVTSTGATGTGKFVFDTSPTISGHPIIEGVTSTGATGTGNFVFSASPTVTGTLTAATITASGTISSAFSTGSTALLQGQNTNSSGYAVIQLLDSSGGGAVQLGYGNSGVASPHTSSAYIYVNDHPFKIVASGNTVPFSVTNAGAGVFLTTLTTGGPTGGNGAGTFKSGTIRTGVALAPSTTNGWQVEVGGSLYTVALYSTNP